MSEMRRSLIEDAIAIVKEGRRSIAAYGTLVSFGWAFLVVVFYSAVSIHILSTIELIVMTVTGNVMTALGVQVYIAHLRAKAKVVTEFIDQKPP